MLAEASLPWLLVAINLPHSVKAKCAHNRQRGSSNWLPITRLWIKDMERGGRAQYGSAVTFILTLWASQERKGLEIVCVCVSLWLLKDEDSFVYLRVRVFSPPWVQKRVNTIGCLYCQWSTSLNKQVNQEETFKKGGSESVDIGGNAPGLPNKWHFLNCLLVCKVYVGALTRLLLHVHTSSATSVELTPFIVNAPLLLLKTNTKKTWKIPASSSCHLCCLF